MLTTASLAVSKQMLHSKEPVGGLDSFESGFWFDEDAFGLENKFDLGFLGLSKLLA